MTNEKGDSLVGALTTVSLLQDHAKRDLTLFAIILFSFSRPVLPIHGLSRSHALSKVALDISSPIHTPIYCFRDHEILHLPLPY